MDSCSLSVGCCLHGCCVCMELWLVHILLFGHSWLCSLWKGVAGWPSFLLFLTDMTISLWFNKHPLGLKSYRWQTSMGASVPHLSPDLFHGLYIFSTKGTDPSTQAVLHLLGFWTLPWTLQNSRSSFHSAKAIVMSCEICTTHISTCFALCLLALWDGCWVC